MNGRRDRPAWWEWVAIVFLLLVAFWFRVYRLPDVPPGLHHDDIKNVLLVDKIMSAGYWRIYYPENYGHEPLYHWLQALYFIATGVDLDRGWYPEVRLLSVGISIAGLAIIYALSARLLGRRVALWTLAWQAVSLWPLFYSRRAIRGVLLPPLAALASYLFIAGLDDKAKPLGRRWLAWSLGGAALAGCLYTYMGSRVLPVFFLLFVLYLALFDRARFRASWRGMLLFAVVAFVLVLPLGIYLASHAEERLGQINLPLNALLQEGDPRPLWENSLRAFGMFTFQGDPYWRQFVADTPVFEPLGAALFYAGVLISLWRWRRFEHAFALLWVPVALVPAMVSEGAPNFLRPIAVLSTIYILPALATVRLVEWLGTRRSALGWTSAMAAIAVLGLNAWRTFDGYFVRWSAHPEVRFTYNSTLLDEGRYLNQEWEVVAPVLSGHFPADLDPAMVSGALQRADILPRWCDIRQSLVFPGGGDALAFQPDYFGFDPALSELFLAGRQAIDERRLADGSVVFRVYPLSETLLERHLAVAQDGPVGWSRAERFPDGLPGDWAALAWPVHFGLADMIGYQVLSGERVAPGEVVTVLTYWRVLGSGPSDGTAFLHVLDPQGRVVGGYDGFGAPPNRWVAGDVVVQVHRFSLPSGLAAGRYPLELGWYARETGLRWQVMLPDGSQVDRLLLQPLTVE